MSAAREEKWPPPHSPFAVRIVPLKGGSWGAFPNKGLTFVTANGATPAEAYWHLMRLTGWDWTGRRWEQWFM